MKQIDEKYLAAQSFDSIYLYSCLAEKTSEIAKKLRSFGYSDVTIQSRERVKNICSHLISAGPVYTITPFYTFDTVIDVGEEYDFIGCHIYDKPLFYALYNTKLSPEDVGFEADIEMLKKEMLCAFRYRYPMKSKHEADPLNRLFNSKIVFPTSTYRKSAKELMKIFYRDDERSGKIMTYYDALSISDSAKKLETALEEYQFTEADRWLFYNLARDCWHDKKVKLQIISNDKNAAERMYNMVYYVLRAKSRVFSIDELKEADFDKNADYIYIPMIDASDIERRREQKMIKKYLRE